MPFTPNENDELAIATIRTLAADIVAKSNSGHPGAPMGLAPIAHLLWSRFLKANPKDSKWISRDRFVLSNGHACALQYIMLHLLGYDLTMDDLKAFRQVDSRTPGHPEVGVTDGVEVTTGPLGQGFANAVGLAIAERHHAATFNKDGLNVIENYTWMFTGDGCLQEGVASEAASLAGHLKLGNLIAIYDDNKITIDGNTNVSFTEDVEKRFEAYGWQVLHVEKGDTDIQAMYDAIVKAQEDKSRPTIINLKTIIGYGSTQQGTHGVHGSPLKADDIKQLKQRFGFNPDETFVVPEKVKQYYAEIAQKGAKAQEEWSKIFADYEKKFPKEASEIKRRFGKELPQGWEKALPVYKPTDGAVASRKLSETVISALADILPELVGGSADLTGSNLTRWKTAVDFQPPEIEAPGDYSGRYIRYGVREHGMGAIMNGLDAYGGIIPFGGTFLNFVSYAAGSVRLSALSHHRVLWVATHDSIGLGEDGPTHQPIETVAHLRAIPNLAVWRPADGNETSAAYLVALQSTHTPSVLCLSRQNLPQLELSTIEKAAKGGYLVAEADQADITIVSTGSEVAIALEAAKVLTEKGRKVRVASLPCWEAFDTQSFDYKLSVLPHGAPIMSVEAYSTIGWSKWSHEHYGINTFGASGPYQEVYAKFKITPAGIAEGAEKVIDFYKKKGGEVVSPVLSALGN